MEILVWMPHRADKRARSVMTTSNNLGIIRVFKIKITLSVSGVFFFFNDTATTEIYTLSLHDALPICGQDEGTELREHARARITSRAMRPDDATIAAPDLPSGLSWIGAEPDSMPSLTAAGPRSEEHTSELQSQSKLVCRLLLEKKTQHVPNGEEAIRGTQHQPRLGTPYGPEGTAAGRRYLGRISLSQTPCRAHALGVSVLASHH